MKKETSMQEIGETLAFIVAKITTMETTMATGGDVAKLADTVVELRVELKEDIADLAHRVGSLEKGQDEILETLNAMSRAQDIDSLAIVDHERRIVRLEEAVVL